ncbi:MAG: LysM peptidoglycan-binding domain-containing protein [Actinomycetota bacterium]|nr:LysM peptidoglycan-binding domain-containing protein [Actinomycetota bacterium]
MRAIPTPARHRRARSPRAAALAAVAGIALAGTASTGSHTVASGDTLSEVAADHGVSVAELAEANGIANPDRVPAGMKLVIPGEKARKDRPAKAKDGDGDGRGDRRDAAEETPERGPNDGAVHTVAPGETLSGIAARYGVTVRELAEANGIADVNRIPVGKRLAIPRSEAEPGVRATAARPGAGADAGDRATTAQPRGGEVDTSRFPALLQSSPERLALVPIFQHWAEVYDVPLDLLMAMTWLESGWQDDVVSSAGAMGIGQLMPDTVTWMRDTIIREPLLDPFDADDNIRMSTAYLRWLLDRTDGDAATALAGYYQGLGAVRSAGVFPSTRAYVADVLAFRDRHF